MASPLLWTTGKGPADADGEEDAAAGAAACFFVGFFASLAGGLDFFSAGGLDFFFSSFF